MKIEISKPEFIKAWQMAERSSSVRSTVGSLGGVLVNALDDKVLLSATDLKTTVKCLAGGASVLNEGSPQPIKTLVFYNHG